MIRWGPGRGPFFFLSIKLRCGGGSGRKMQQQALVPVGRATASVRALSRETSGSCRRTCAVGDGGLRSPAARTSISRFLRHSETPQVVPLTIRLSWRGRERLATHARGIGHQTSQSGQPPLPPALPHADAARSRARRGVMVVRCSLGAAERESRRSRRRTFKGGR